MKADYKSNYIELLDFISDLIGVEIQKYTQLATIGIGPDAKMNAKLVMEEVNDLLAFSKHLLDSLKYGRARKILFTSICNQVQFYLSQEDLRGHAGWLMDENNPHDAVYKRTSELQKRLQGISMRAGAEIPPYVKPQTPIQEQCEVDSHAIALYILEQAVTLIRDPSAALDKNIPMHAQSILRKHAQAGGRYHQFEIKGAIEALYQQCQTFMCRTTLQKSQGTLEKEDVQAVAQSQRETLNTIRERLHKIKGASCENATRYLRSYGIFAAAAIPVAAVLVGACIQAANSTPVYKPA